MPDKGQRSANTVQIACYSAGSISETRPSERSRSQYASASSKTQTPTSAMPVVCAFCIMDCASSLERPGMHLRSTSTTRSLVFFSSLNSSSLYFLPGSTPLVAVVFSRTASRSSVVAPPPVGLNDGFLERPRSMSVGIRRTPLSGRVQPLHSVRIGSAVPFARRCTTTGVGRRVSVSLRRSGAFRGCQFKEYG